MTVPLWKRLRKPLFTAGVVLAMGASTAQAQLFPHHRHRQHTLPPDCPPVYIHPPTYVPPTPRVPPPETEPKKDIEPKKDFEPTPISPPALEAPGLGPEAFAALGSASFSAPANSPNMFGALFGGAPARAIITRPPVIVSTSENFFIRNSDGSLQRIVPTIGSDGRANFTTIAPASLGTVTVPSGTVFTSLDVVPQSPAPLVVPLAENAGVTSLVTQEFMNRSGSIGTASYGSGVANLVSGSGSGDVYRTDQDQYTIGPLSYSYTGFIEQPPIIIDIPNPAGGGTVGRLQLAEDISVLPRDRFIFNYDYFNNVPLTTNGWDVNRFVLGFEKTFFDQRTSIELRVPFASTLDSTVNTGLESTNTEFGNIRLLLKALLLRGERLNVASGLAIHVPTADDTLVRFADGTDLVRINNDAVILTPYVGALLTPNDRLFAQGWLAFDFDTGGNPVLANTNFTGLTDVGRLTAQTLMQLNGQIGYWVVQSDDPNALLRGLAPFIELHYFTTLGDPDIIINNGFVIGDLAGNRDELDLSFGGVAQLGNRANLSAGVVVPLRDKFGDRSFDFQFGMRLNVFFGPTAQRPTPATFVSGF